MINALLHADYSQRGAPIRIAFFDDRIEVENPGILLPGLTIEDMKQGVSRIRNPVIARVFRELGLIEQWGSGVRRIFAEAAEQNLPAPQIVEIGMRVRFIVRLIAPIHVANPATPEVTPEVKRMLEILQRDMSRAEVMAALGLHDEKHFRQSYQRAASAKGLIEMTLPDKPNSRLQKYRLTAKGRALLTSNKP